MSGPLRTLLRRLATRAAILAVWLVAHTFAARWLADWDAGLHLLAGGRGAGYALGLLLAFFAVHLTTYFILPVIAALTCVRIAVQYTDEARARARAG